MSPSTAWQLRILQHVLTLDTSGALKVLQFESEGLIVNLNSIGAGNFHGDQLYLVNGTGELDGTWRSRIDYLLQLAQNTSVSRAIISGVSSRPNFWP